MMVKIVCIWLLFVVAAMMNGTLREELLVAALGDDYALPLSGLLLSLLIFLITYLTIPWLRSALLKPSASKSYVMVGFVWLVLTLMFEFTFGLLVAEKTFVEIVQVLNVLEGNLFSIVLLVTTVSPLMAARLKGYIQF